MKIDFENEVVEATIKQHIRLGKSGYSLSTLAEASVMLRLGVPHEERAEFKIKVNEYIAKLNNL